MSSAGDTQIMASQNFSSHSFDPLASSAPLIVYIDYKSPYAYLAVDPTCAMADELGVEIDWRPFTLDIPSYLGSARLNNEGKVVENDRSPGQWTKVKYAYHDVRRYGSMRGRIIRGTVKVWDSSLAGIGMLFAKEQGKDILRAYSALMYERFWKRELDIEDVGVIEQILKEAGANTDSFKAYASSDGRALHDSIQQRAFDAGIFGVPTYIVGGEMFFGREHLPRIRWILTGRHGAPPDIAYQEFPARPGPASASDGSQHLLPVVIDFTSPQAYLAIGPTCALADELRSTASITVDWQPLVLPPSKTPPAATAEDDRGARHRRFRADYIDRDFARYAADRGLAIEGLQQRQDSTLAAIGLLWVKRQVPSLAQRFVERVFTRYWHKDLDLKDESAIRALLREIAVPISGFEEFVSGDGRDQHAQLQSELRDRGVFEVPTYVVNDDLYLGRQHLPLIRSLLISKEPATN
jgi:2-hydroxychromene-2-carboxylate isomerase